MPESIGNTLKTARKKANYTVEDVSNILVKKGLKAGKNTVYSWENDNSMPTPDALLTLCKIYGISDILSVFGYSSENAAPSMPLDGLSVQEYDLIMAFRELNDVGRETSLHQVKAMSGIHPRVEPTKKSNAV